MVARLQLMAQQIQENPTVDKVANSARVRLLEQTPPPAALSERGNNMALLAEELLRAGRTQAAIDTWLELRALVAAEPATFPEAYDVSIWDNLAIERTKEAGLDGLVRGLNLVQGDSDLYVGNESSQRVGVNPCQLFENN